MRPRAFALAVLAIAAELPGQTAVTPAPLEPFAKVRLSGDYWSEGASTGDFNRDGKRDVVCGPWWWEGPSFAKRRPIYAGRSFPITGYSDNFFSFVHDVDGDGWDDVLTVGFPGTDATWYRNPRGADVLWTKHLVWPWVGIESPAFTDLDRDGKPELVCSSFGLLLYLKPDATDATKPWTPHLVWPGAVFPVFTHGLGVGDVNGDGRVDIVTVQGWFEQPPSLQNDPPWTAYAYRFGAGAGGGQMLVHDVDGDGDADVVTSIHAHAWGLSWFEQVRVQGQITFREHVIQKPVRDPFDPDQLSQPHALALADMNRDGLLDFVTGKAFYAHNGNDPGEGDPALLYWFELRRQGGVRFLPHLVDGDSGVGRQVTVADVDGDGRLDIVTGCKKGVFVLRQQ